MSAHLLRNAAWLGFFATILVSWVWLYGMSTGMGLDLIGRPTMPMNMDGMAMDGAEMGAAEMGGADTAMPMDGAADQAMPATQDMAMDAAAPAAGAAALVDAPSMDMDSESGMAMEGGSDMAMDGMAMDDMAMDGMDMSAMTRFGPLWGMWSVMMAAMMLPTLVPTLRTYEDLMVSADGTRAGWLGVLLGYFAVWVVFAAAITLAQMGLLASGLVDTMGMPTSRWLAAGLLVAVGLFQFTRAKEICHGVCHTPMTYFLGHWRADFVGGLWMGVGLGAFCAGCCWGFMSLGFVGGMMSLLWMGAATLFMVIEKLPQIGRIVTKPMGVALCLGGVVVAAWPYLQA
ncbi:MAG: DUF2182 domain-containing protein [Pseudomonadota bacterium]